MSVSLTNAGLYLEPRVYVGSSSGNNYGTPRFVAAGGVSLGGGTWAGIYNYSQESNTSTLAISVAFGVSSSSGGGIYFRVS